MKTLLLTIAALAAAAGLIIALTLAPARVALPAPSDGTIRGILHVHTNRSDGRGTPEEIAAIAARAGLAFLAFTDHGDATRAPDPPVYRSGVLCLDGVEISTTGGHYVALNLPRAPYPLGGEARDVVDDVRRLGGFGIVAHPDSPKPELRWQDWAAPFDAVELVNPDTSWRVRLQAPGWRPALGLFAALLDYPVRPAETLASLLQHPSETLGRWDEVTRRRRVVGLSGADAHARLAPRYADPGNNRWSVPLPSYEASFQMLSVHVRPDRALSGDAAADAALILRALGAGHAYTAIDGFASPPSFEFTATNEHGTVHEGDELGVGGPVTLRVRSNAPAGFTTIISDGARVFSGDHHEPDFTSPAPAAPAVYWTEILASGRSPQLPWILSNPIYVRGAAAATRAPGRPAVTRSEALFNGRDAEGWHLEHDRVSLAALDVAPTVEGAELRLRYALAGEADLRPYVALYCDMRSGLLPYDRVVFTVRAEHPMRISVQLRVKGAVGERWQRSVYVDAFDQERTVAFDELTPVGVTPTRLPPFAAVGNVMFVVDNTNTKPGSSGRLWIKKASLQR